MMKIGVRAHDFGRMSATELAKTIKEAGFDCTQLAPTKSIEGIMSFGGITPKHLEDAREAFGNAGVEITVLGCYIEPSYTDNAARLEQVEHFRNALVNAKILGAPIVGTETTNLDIATPAAEREKIYQLLKDSVLRMAEKAEKEDVLIGIEPVAEHTLNTPELTRRLLDEVNSKKLKVIFDPVNMVLPDTIHAQDAIFTQMFNLLGDEITAMHIKDTVIENNQKTWRKIGEGVINYKLIFDWLHANKPEIRLLREGVQMDSFTQDRKAMQLLAKL
jgi:sugar phosphate isomerase/epimerase